MTAREVIRFLEADGWREVRSKGSHRQYHHPTRRGTTTVPMHGSRDLPIMVIRSIERQSGLRLRKE